MTISSLEALKFCTSREDITIFLLHGVHSLLPLDTFNGLSKLKMLDLSYNQVVELLPHQFSGLFNLQTLSLVGNKLNKLSPEQFLGLNNLRWLDLSHNQLTELSPRQFEGLINLQELILSNNHLTKLSPQQFEGLNNLQTLDLWGNQLTELSPQQFEGLDNLRKLYLSDNQLTKLAPQQFQELNNLQTLYLSRNQLTKLAPQQFTGLNNLQALYLVGNRLTELPIQLIELRNLTYFYYLNNPIRYLPPQLRRFLDHLNQANRQGQEVYDDAQSVHNSSIQRTFIESVNRLTQGKPDLTLGQTLEEIIASTLPRECIEGLIQYAQSPEIHSVINLNFGELLVSVWDRIRISPHKENIFTVLNQEILDSECKCFTGRVTRLVNCLSGFDDDVHIEISETEQLANIATLARNKFFTLEEQKDYFATQARERDFPEDVINAWIDGF